jgi:CRISPR/Cas system CSM-associated protein Csm3 (group 7 of RAMP superfamily)
MSILKQLTLDYTLELQSDFHVGSGAGIAGSVDRAVMRLANGELVVPGSTIKGRVRHHCEQLARALNLQVCGGRPADAELCKPRDDQEAGRQLCIICRLFGSEWWPATVRFSDARLPSQLRNLVYQQRHDAAIDPDFDYQVVSRTRTRMNRVLRRVEERALFTFQEGVEGLVFEGHIAGSTLCVEVEAGGLPLEVLLLVAGLKLLESLGGKKTVGLGSCRLTVKNMSVERKVMESQLDEVLRDSLKEMEYYDLHRDA